MSLTLDLIYIYAPLYFFRLFSLFQAHRYSNFFPKWLSVALAGWSGCNLCVANCVSRIAAFPFSSGMNRTTRGEMYRYFTPGDTGGSVGWRVSLDYNNPFIERLLVRLQRTAVVNNNAENTGRRETRARSGSLGRQQLFLSTLAGLAASHPRERVSLYNIRAIPSGVDNNTSQYETRINCCTRILLRISTWSFQKFAASLRLAFTA